MRLTLNEKYKLAGKLENADVDENVGQCSTLIANGGKWTNSKELVLGLKGVGLTERKHESMRFFSSFFLHFSPCLARLRKQKIRWKRDAS